MSALNVRRTLQPQELTFNFDRHFLQSPDFCLHAKENLKAAENSGEITESTVLKFSEFIECFEFFAIRSRKDLKDIFDSLIVEQKSEMEPVGREIDLERARSDAAKGFNNNDDGTYIS